MTKTKNKPGDRVYHPKYGYGTIREGGLERVERIDWDNGKHGGAEVKQLETEEEAKKQGF